MRFVRYLIIAFVVIVLAVMLTDMARADEETVRRVAQEEGIDPDLAAAVARCESGFNHNARNGRYRGTFQMSPSWDSHDGTVEDQTREFAASVKAGSASRHWACWPRGRRIGGAARGAPRPAPTGTDRCDRETGEWRCHPSWTKPDALTVSPTIETDPGAHIISCAWEGERWKCKTTGIPPSSVEPFQAFETLEILEQPEQKPSLLKILGALVFSALCGWAGYHWGNRWFLKHYGEPPAEN